MIETGNLILAEWRDAQEVSRASDLEKCGKFATAFSVGWAIRDGDGLTLCRTIYAGTDASDNGPFLSIPAAWINGIWRLQFRTRTPLEFEDIPESEKEMK